MAKELKMNAVKCSHCGAVIRSLHVHDFQQCRCTDPDTAICVDGGPEYARRVYGVRASWTEVKEPPNAPAP